MGQRRKFSAEYTRETVAMLNAPGISIGQVAADLGIGAAVLVTRPANVGRTRSEDWASA